MYALHEFFNNVVSNLRTFQVRDLIDILVISFVFYELFVFARKSRAGQLVRGLVLLLVCFALAYLLELRTVRWLLNNFLQVAFIAAVVLFQPELRRALDQIGRSKWTRQMFSSQKKQSSGRTEQHVAEIVRALNNMSRKKIGALIVFERSTGLGDVIESGTVVDAEISDPLIENIFEPNTPLHDGAMVIRDERIVAAACILQLSEDYTISRELGTRHRAAIGITEATDAVSLIVSEETGIISMARDGKLTRYLDVKSLTILLTELFAPKARKSTSWVSTVSERLSSMSSKSGSGRGKEETHEE